MVSGSQCTTILWGVGPGYVSNHVTVIPLGRRSRVIPLGGGSTAMLPTLPGSRGSRLWGRSRKRGIKTGRISFVFRFLILRSQLRIVHLLPRLILVIL